MSNDNGAFFCQLDHNVDGEAELAKIIMVCALAASRHSEEPDPPDPYLAHLTGDQIKVFYHEIRNYFQSETVYGPTCRERVDGIVSDMEDSRFSSILVCVAGDITTIHAEIRSLPADPADVGATALASYEAQRPAFRARHGLPV